MTYIPLIILNCYYHVTDVDSGAILIICFIICVHI